jgi:MAF protein
MKRLILASKSPRRMALLRTCGIDYVAIPANTPEEPRSGESPRNIVLRIAREKAESIRRQGKWLECTILAADTIVADGDEILGKPANINQAREFLAQLRGRTHRVITGISLWAPDSDTPLIESVETSVRMREYTEAEMEEYLCTGDGMDKAGAYAIQHSVFQPVASWNGCYTNVVGLPVCRVYNLLRGIGWEGMTALPKGCQDQSDCGFSRLTVPLKDN